MSCHVVNAAPLLCADLPSSSSVKRSPGECDVLVKVEHSSLNYKDAMVTTGNYPGKCSADCTRM